MMLGELLAQARRSAGLLDDALRAEIERAGEAPDAFARVAVTEFERFASDEDWATLMSRIRRADDPGAACLDTMVRWQLGGALPAEDPRAHDGRPR